MTTYMEYVDLFEKGTLTLSSIKMYITTWESKVLYES